MSNTSIVEGKAIHCFGDNGDTIVLIENEVKEKSFILSIDFSDVQMPITLGTTYRIIGHLESEMIQLEHGQMLVNRIIADHVEAIK